MKKKGKGCLIAILAVFVLACVSALFGGKGSGSKTAATSTTAVAEASSALASAAASETAEPSVSAPQSVVLQKMDGFNDADNHETTLGTMTFSIPSYYVLSEERSKKEETYEILVYSHDQAQGAGAVCEIVLLNETFYDKKDSFNNIYFNCTNWFFSKHLCCNSKIQIQ